MTNFVNIRMRTKREKYGDFFMIIKTDIINTCKRMMIRDNI